jgi:CDP-paratose synthetase
MRILITGVTGYLGSHLASALLGRGDEVVGIKRTSSSLARIEELLPKLELHDADAIDVDNLDLHIRKIGHVDAIIHTATCYGRKGERVEELLYTNLVFPLKLLNAAIDSDISLFLNTDTALEKSLNSYALSKGQFAEWGHYYADQNQIQFLNIKLEHFYGPNDDPEKFTAHVINSFLNNVPELNLTFGEQQRDFIYIDDVISAYIVLLDKYSTFEEKYIDIEMGSGIAISIKQFVETVHKLTQSQTRLNFGALPYRTGETMLSIAKIDRLKALGWLCERDIEEGVKLTICK